MITSQETEDRMKELINILNPARFDYYNGLKESELSDKQYDAYSKELMNLESSSGIILSGSPSASVGTCESSDKIKHIKPILSLKDTKNVDDLLRLLKEKEGVLSWKLDGLSIVLYYNDGKLLYALSRGDGHYGKDITTNVKCIKGVPLKIPVKTFTVIRGEGCIATKEFDDIKKTKEGERFSNPRNLAAGLINRKVTSKILLRHMTFIVHNAIVLDEPFEKYSDQLDYLQSIGFKTVPYLKVLNFELVDAIQRFTEVVSSFAYPVDGLVLVINDLAYAQSLGATAKFPKGSIAFKWPDETKETFVSGIKWSVSKTGLITPVVIFEPVLLEGTVVHQANLHTLKGFEKLQLGYGDTIVVYKADKIIPEVEENLTRSNGFSIPKTCPVCGGKTFIMENDKTKKLYCERCKNG